jgi:outer membrane cobalamin receptor
MKEPPASVVSDTGAFLICGSSKLSSAILAEPPDSIVGLGCCCCCVFSGVLILLLGPDDIIIFGLNTLGGAISIQTKDGRNNPGGSMQFTGGSWGRKIGEFEYGGVSKDNSIDYFVAGTWFDEDGWRQHSPSDNKQLFTKLGWRGEKTDLHLTYALSQSDLNGNGVIPKSMLATGYDKVYSWPDNTQNKSHFLNLDWPYRFVVQ